MCPFYHVWRVLYSLKHRIRPGNCGTRSHSAGGVQHILGQKLKMRKGNRDANQDDGGAGNSGGCVLGSPSGAVCPEASGERRTSVGAGAASAFGAQTTGGGGAFSSRRVSGVGTVPDSGQKHRSNRTGGGAELCVGCALCRDAAGVRQRSAQGAGGQRTYLGVVLSEQRQKRRQGI